MLAADILVEARGLLNARTNGQSFWRDEDLFRYLDHAEAHFRSLVSSENEDFMHHSDPTVTYPASARSVDFVSDERFAAVKNAETIRLVLDETDTSVAPFPVPEVPWHELPDYDVPATGALAVQRPIDRVFGWSGRDFALRPVPTSDTTLRIRFIGKRKRIRGANDEAVVLPDDFSDMYALRVAVLAKETKGGEDAVQLRKLYAERERDLLARMRQRTRTPDYIGVPSEW